jgi:hypothetical protein
MHIPISNHSVNLKRFSLNTEPITPATQPVISNNRVVGLPSAIPSTPVPSNTMASMGMGLIDFNRSVKRASQNIQKKRDKHENIKFVF